MVFHDIDSVTDVISGHRIILYYIEGNISDAKHNKINLLKSLELIMAMLEKKNDDLLIVKVLQTSLQFNQFQELYKSEINGVVTLFAVNNEGIPVICEHINEEDNIVFAIKALSEACNLKCISKSDISQVIHPHSQSVSSLSEKISKGRPNLKPIECFPTESNSQDTEKQTTAQMLSGSANCFSTELQIRLPDGKRDIHTFDKNAKLQEVWIYISVTYNLRDFDMKTYNHQIFTEEDYVTTLQDLGLYPNGVLMVVNKNVPFNNRGGISATVQYLFHCLSSRTFSLVQYVHGLVHMFWNSLFSSNGRPGPNSRSDRQIRNQLRSSEDESGYSNSQARSRKSLSRGFGNNIHTLHRDSDSDDENNRYNGNSTQQK